MQISLRISGTLESKAQEPEQSLKQVLAGLLFIAGLSGNQELNIKNEFGVYSATFKLGTYEIEATYIPHGLIIVNVSGYTGDPEKDPFRRKSMESILRARGVEIRTATKKIDYTKDGGNTSPTPPHY